jgi:hypothetical protein
MMLPPFTTLLVGVAVISVLAVVDWYVWRLTDVGRSPFTPSGRRDGEDGNCTVLKEVA